MIQVDKMFPENMKAARKAKNLTQEELAEICGVTPSCVSRWETGAWSPSPKHQEILSQVFDSTDDPLTKIETIGVGTQMIKEVVCEMQRLNPKAQEIVLELARQLKELQDSS